MTKKKCLRRSSWKQRHTPSEITALTTQSVVHSPKVINVMSAFFFWEALDEQETCSSLIPALLLNRDRGITFIQARHLLNRDSPLNSSPLRRIHISFPANQFISLNSRQPRRRWSIFPLWLGSYQFNSLFSQHPSLKSREREKVNLLPDASRSHSSFLFFFLGIRAANRRFSWLMHIQHVP